MTVQDTLSLAEVASLKALSDESVAVFVSPEHIEKLVRLGLVARKGATPEYRVTDSGFGVLLSQS